MLEFFSKLFDTSDFPPRWRCGLWDEGHGWLHIVSDLAIFGAYTAIPLVIAYFAVRRKDVPFLKIFWLFVIFIFACGTTHLIEAIIFWQPVYRFAGVVKLLTAVASWSTVFALVPIVPKALHLPGLATLNTELAGEIEERKSTELALRESQERLRLALASGRMGTWEWHVPTGQVHWSPEVERIHGLRPGSFSGRFDAVLDDVHPDDKDKVRESIQRTLEAGEEHHVEYRIVLPDGRMRWVEGRGRAFHDENGAAQRMVGVCTDVTDRKQAEAERESLLASEREARSSAEQANRMTDEFLSVVSHELRTPLSAILGYAQLLTMDLIDEDERQETYAAIERNGLAQVQIIDDLLDMSRIISGKLRLSVRSINPADVIQAALQTVKLAADAKGVHIHQSLDPKTRMVRGDFDRLQQVVWNLLSNAVKFTPQGGRVDVTLRQVDSHAEFVVSDSGCGIAADFLPHVFERFRQGEDPTTRSHGGLGLGLSIVKQLVELHGGTVQAHSDGEDRGAKFVVTLPVQTVPAIETTDGVGVDANHDGFGLDGAPNLCGLRVLVVDDESDAADVVRRLLESRGAEAVTAYDVPGALDVLNRETPDIIISDIGMPGTDGYEFIRQVRSRPYENGGTTPAVALTAFARSEDRTRALLAGFQSHVTKPVDPGELVAVVAMLSKRTVV